MGMAKMALRKKYATNSVNIPMNVTYSNSFNLLHREKSFRHITNPTLKTIVWSKKYYSCWVIDFSLCVSCDVTTKRLHRPDSIVFVCQCMKLLKKQHNKRPYLQKINKVSHKVLSFSVDGQTENSKSLTTLDKLINNNWLQLSAHSQKKSRKTEQLISAVENHNEKRFLQADLLYQSKRMPYRRDTNSRIKLCIIMIW